MRAYNGRPALRQLIADVASGPNVFDTILVYDVLRWGRFQHADKSATDLAIRLVLGPAVECCQLRGDRNHEDTTPSTHNTNWQ